MAVQLQMRANPEERWRRMRFAAVAAAAIVLSLPVALMPVILRRAKPSMKSAIDEPSSWTNPHCIYILLNIVILAISVKSGLIFGSSSSATATVDCVPATSTTTTVAIHTENMKDELLIMVPEKPRITEGSSGLSFMAETMKEAVVQKQRADSCRKRPMLMSLPVRPSSAKLSQMWEREAAEKNFEAPAAETTSNEKLNENRNGGNGNAIVVFEICAAPDDYADIHGHGHELCFEAMSKDELYNKSEEFITKVRKDLRMQREKSWQRLRGMITRSF